MRILDNGAWDGLDVTHHTDASLAAEICDVCASLGIRTALDLGAGIGAYVMALRINGIAATGVDGNPKAQEASNGTVLQADLSQPIYLPGADAVICLEVGEHIPMKFENTLLDNISRHANRLILLSWAAPGQLGSGHVNCREQMWVVQQMAMRQWTEAITLSNQFRYKATLPWFKKNLMAFRPSI